MELTEQQAKTKKRFDKGIDIFGIIIAAVTLGTILLFFIRFGLVYNTEVGAEVKFTGFSAMIAALSRNYESAEKIYGDIAVPFYYYAKRYMIILSILAAVAFFMLLISLILRVFDIFFDKTAIRYIATLLTLLASFALIACFVAALLMKNGDILTTYCQNNPNCSIRSYAIIPAITALVGAIAGFIHLVKKIA